MNPIAIVFTTADTLPLISSLHKCCIAALVELKPHIQHTPTKKRKPAAKKPATKPAAKKPGRTR